ncbi:MAG: DUF1127 domain-containing protein [Pseudomonadota bacterium]
MAHARNLSPDVLNVLLKPGTPVLAVIAVRFAFVLTTWATRRRTRLALRQLEGWQLDDVGLTPGQAMTEASRVFWRS